MINFFIEGGIVFTLPMTLLFFLNLFLIARNIFFLSIKRLSITDRIKKSIDYINYIGIFLLSVGFLGQVFGLYSAFQVLEHNGVQVTPSIIIAGFKTSSHTTLLGLSYFVISFGAWVLLKRKVNQEELEDQ